MSAFPVPLLRSKNPGFLIHPSQSVWVDCVEASRRCGSGGGCGNSREALTKVRQRRHFDGPAWPSTGLEHLVADIWNSRELLEESMWYWYAVSLNNKGCLYVASF